MATIINPQDRRTSIPPAAVSREFDGVPLAKYIPGTEVPVRDGDKFVVRTIEKVAIDGDKLRVKFAGVAEEKIYGKKLPTYEYKVSKKIIDARNKAAYTIVERAAKTDGGDTVVEYDVQIPGQTEPLRGVNQDLLAALEKVIKMEDQVKKMEAQFKTLSSERQLGLVKVLKELQDKVGSVELPEIKDMNLVGASDAVNFSKKAETISREAQRAINDFNVALLAAGAQDIAESKGGAAAGKFTRHAETEAEKKLSEKRLEDRDSWAKDLTAARGRFVDSEKSKLEKTGADSLEQAKKELSDFETKYGDIEYDINAEKEQLKRLEAKKRELETEKNKLEADARAQTKAAKAIKDLERELKDEKDRKPRDAEKKIT